MIQRMLLNLGLVFLLVLILAGALEAGGDEPVSYLDASVPTPDNWVKPSPAEGSAAATNPASFVWLPEPDAESYTLQYSRRKDFGSDATVSVQRIKLNMHHPAETIKPGQWYWRYRAVRADGSTSVWSSMRSFTMPKDAVEFTLPPIDEVLARIPKGRPRLFVTLDTLAAVRQARFGNRKAIWDDLQPRIDDMLEKPLMEEPVPYPDGKWDVEIWRPYLRAARNMGYTIEHLGFGYLITGDRKYADAAKRQIMEICTWDPAGTSSFKYNDEVAMPIILSVSRAYDWIYDTFTPEEREKVQHMMRVRGEEIYRLLRRVPYEAKPYASHQTRVLKFIGQASIAFLGEIDEASEWFEYLMNIFYCIYPPWGDTDGSYHEGPSYWSAYFNWAQQFATALKTATGIDLYQKPFFRNTGYWALYCIPPYAAMVPFGDATSGRAGAGQKNNLYRLSSVYKDPYLRWYADAVPSSLSKGLMLYLWHDDSVKAKAPEDLPPSRAFLDTGEVAMHSRLGSPQEDVYLLLSSDPLGSWSHAHADQNSFYLQAFGEALAISSGYYPWYGSSHHKQWRWETKAHNSILVDGEGQVTRSMSSQGRVAAHLFSPRFDYARGDAAKAYGGKLTKFLRHVLFLRPDYFVMIDELEAREPSTFDWLLHSWEQMDVDEQANRVTISRGDARLLVEFVEPGKLTLSQTDQFTVPPENDAANQWHLTASTASRSNKADLVTVMYPYRAAEENSLPTVERIEALGASGVSVTSGKSRDTVVLNRFDSALPGLRIRSDGHIVALRETADTPRAVFMLDGTLFAVGTDELVSTGSPVTLAMELSKSKRSLIVQSVHSTELRLTMPEARSKGLMGATLGKQGRSPTTGDMRDPRLFRGTVKVDGRRLSAAEFAFDRGTGAITLKLGPGEHMVDIQS